MQIDLRQPPPNGVRSELITQVVNRLRGHDAQDERVHSKRHHGHFGSPVPGAHEVEI